MTCQEIGFALGNCLVEISRDASTGEGLQTYTAFVSFLEHDCVHGSLVRPVVASNGHRVKIRAESESLALSGAISYLSARFGPVSQTSHPCSLGAATFGRPIELQD